MIPTLPPEPDLPPPASAMDGASEHLLAGETVEMTLTAQLRPYLSRSALTVGLTSLLALPFILFFHNPNIWFLIPVVAVVDLFLFDNLDDLRQQRGRTWVLTNLRLLQIDTRPEPAFAALDRSALARVRRLGWWKLFVVGDNAGIIEIAYAPEIAALRAALLNDLQPGDIAQSPTARSQGRKP
ncbi:MAG: hypothetical protein ACRBBV_15750 [Paracoccaceae bacterium]